MHNETATQSRTEYWRAHIESWRGSGQSQRSYCQDQDLSYAQFIYWRRKFPPNQSGEEKKPVRSGFVEVTPTAPTPSVGLSLVLPNGLELRGISAENLTVVHQLLSRLA